ncbi:hypothetical protein [Butyrivibrio fibrisolvens]|uniref:hypothetical protein n=1 Tax=Butyrivibrio fibrisolvens TaxID=831 RepID=UPI0020BE7C73|nr:hypothetical protein [Butyrivibrio fibrisolvens]
MDASFDEVMIKNRIVRNIIFIIAGLVVCFGISFAYALYQASFIIDPFLISHSRWYIFYTFIVAVLACMAGVIGYNAICRGKYILSQGMTYVIIMLVLGMLYTMVMVPLSVPDEPTHYNNALVVSNKIITFLGEMEHLHKEKCRLSVLAMEAIFMTFGMGLSMMITRLD